MPSLAAIARLRLVLEVDHFGSFAVLDDLGDHHGICHCRAADRDLVAVGNEEDIAQFDARTGLRG